MGLRPQPCIESCPFLDERRRDLGCRPTEGQVASLGGDALRAYAMCMTTRMNRRDLDPLTGLLGYERFMAEAEHHIEIVKQLHGRRVKGVPPHVRSALVGFIDGDGLKAVNDGQHGHHGGDRVIQATGKVTLRSVLGDDERSEKLVLGCFREGEAMAARRSGDEFVYALFGLEPRSASQVARRVDHRLTNIRVRSLGIKVSATMSSRYLPHLTSYRQFEQAIRATDRDVNRMKEERRKANRR